MLHPASAPPPHISPEHHAQLTSSTPADFGAIPPVLRWAGEEVVVQVGGEGWWSASAGATAGANVNGAGSGDAVMDGQETDGEGAQAMGEKVGGRLWVTEKEIVFLPTDPNSLSPPHGFSLAYPALTLHALTPASASDAVPAHVYCQVDETSAALAAAGGEGGDDGEDWVMREVRIFVPEGQLEPLFHALSDCSALHDSLLPDGRPSSFPFFDGDEDEANDEEDNGAWEDADEDEGGANGTGAGRHETTGADASELRGSGDPDASDEVDQVRRFEDMVDWGNVPKPAGW